MAIVSKDSFGVKKDLNVAGKNYKYFDVADAAKKCGFDLAKLPKSLKVLFENLLRNENDEVVSKADIEAIGGWLEKKSSTAEINYHPARVVMQDFTGVPAVVDLAAMRDAMVSMGGDPEKINPQVPVDLVIDHSVAVDHYGDSDSFEKNVELEFERNKERYEFLKWGQGAFKNFRVVPPGTGIIHQVNLENLAQVVWTDTVDGDELAYCDTCVGTDSHTTMINGVSVLGWGVGGIEAEAAMLGQPVTMMVPDVIGFKLDGKLSEGVTATDLVLRIVEMLRAKGVVGKFVEFYGDGLAQLSLEDRATIANMAPEYGATMGFFPIDDETIKFLEFTGRDKDRVALVKEYAKAQGLWRNDGDAPEFTSSLELDISTVEPAIAGPKRPQDRINLSAAATTFQKDLKETFKVENTTASSAVEGEDFSLHHGDVMIAAITSCTNTSNPSVIIGAGLVAKKAIEKGLKVKPWVKTSLAPGSRVVTDYLEKAGLQTHLNDLGFTLAGYGCTTCIGNSGPLKPKFSKSIADANLVATSVLSGNRNFEGRISPDIKANYLASPPLVVAYAIAGNLNIDITKEALGKDKDGNDVFLTDIWPSNQEVKEAMRSALTPEMFTSRYANVFDGTQDWQNVKTTEGQTYSWDPKSTYVKNPPFFEGITPAIAPMKNVESASVLALLGDSVTTDHISPAGSIMPSSPAGVYLKERGVSLKDFNSYGSRRGNDDVMARGTFANIRIKNEMVPGVEGGYTKHIPSGEQMSMYDAAMKYISEGTPLVVFAGKEYGTGSSRDWAAKGTRLQGIKAVVAESFERIHRSNLIGMGVLPLQFDGTSKADLALKGDEKITLTGVDSMGPKATIKCDITYSDGSTKSVDLKSRIDTGSELDYYKNGGILHYVLRRLNA